MMMMIFLSKRDLFKNRKSKKYSNPEKYVSVLTKLHPFFYLGEGKITKKSFLGLPIAHVINKYSSISKQVIQEMEVRIVHLLVDFPDISSVCHWNLSLR